MSLSVPEGWAYVCHFNSAAESCQGIVISKTSRALCMVICVSVFTVPPSFSLWIWPANIAVFVWISSACSCISFMFCGWHKVGVFSFKTPTVGAGHGTWQNVRLPKLLSVKLAPPTHVCVLSRVEFHAESCSFKWAWQQVRVVPQKTPGLSSSFFHSPESWLL